MRKTMISTLLAVTLAFTSTTAPVMADDRTDQLIAGAILLGILGAALNEGQRRDGGARIELRHGFQPDRRHVTPLLPETGNRHVQPRRTRALPAECLRRYRTQEGRVRLFDADCLEHNFRGYRHLPLDCAVTIRSQGRFESGFRPRCLRRAGYQMAGR